MERQTPAALQYLPLTTNYGISQNTNLEAKRDACSRPRGERRDAAFT